MKKDTIWVLIGTALSIGVGYYAYKRFFKTNVVKVPDTRNADNFVLDQPQEQNKTEDTSGSVISSITNPVVKAVGGVFEFLSNWNDYTVNTVSTPLNVRQSPSTSSKVIASIPKGTVVKAKASGTKDWLAVSKDGKTTFGYVSAQYMKVKA